MRLLLYPVMKSPLKGLVSAPLSRGSEMLGRSYEGCVSLWSTRANGGENIQQDHISLTGFAQLIRPLLTDPAGGLCDAAEYE